MRQVVICGLATLLVYIVYTSAYAGEQGGSPLAKGDLMIDISDVIGHSLPAKVALYGEKGAEPFVFPAHTGRASAKAPVGRYRAYVYVYEFGVPVLADVQDVTVSETECAFVLLSLVEGVSGQRTLLDADFDADMDLVTDRAEVKAGTDPRNPASAPGQLAVPLENVVLDEEAGWLRGELHARSSYGGGSESVAKLIKRAEKEKLDFLAITDRNTMDSCMDPDYGSKKLVLVPAMEWGDDKRGVALIYGARTVPEPAETYGHAQAIVRRVQAQGGVFAIAHPCFPQSSWQWGLDHVNAVQVWCRDWLSVPPMSFASLREDLQLRGADRPARESGSMKLIPGKTVPGKPVFPIGVAASTTSVSANGQAEIFWDVHLQRGLRASPIAGSHSSDRSVPLGRPLTYVYANQKSLAGVLDGLRRGRTFVTSGPKGPFVDFHASIALKGGRTVSIPIGGILPLHYDAFLVASVKGAKGMKLQFCCDGSPIMSKTIEDNNDISTLPLRAEEPHVYRVRVVTPSPAMTGGASSRARKGVPAFGPLEVHALTSPIYAQPLPLPAVEAKEGADDEGGVEAALKAVEKIQAGEDAGNWRAISSEGVPPVYATAVKEEGGKTYTYVQIDRSVPRRYMPHSMDDEPPIPPGARSKELVPEVVMGER